MTSLLEPCQVPRLVLDLLPAGRRFAVATVLQAEGHTPVKAGACAIIEADGTLHGTVGGGAVEAEALRRAQAALRSGRCEQFAFDLLGDDPAETLPICGGRMRLLIDPATARARAAYEAAAAALENRRRGVWVLRLQPGETLEVTAQYCAADCQSAEPSGDCFVLPLHPPPLLVVVGGGHVGRAVVAQASLIGFDILVLEDRPEFADPTRFPPGTRTRCGDVAQALRNLAVDGDTFIVLVSRGHQQDAEALRACIRRSAAYLGMIGSRRKVPLLRRQFIEAGWATAEEFDRVYAPIGLDLGAVTVPEIAAEIVAQLIAVRRTGRAPRLPKREG